MRRIAYQQHMDTLVDLYSNMEALTTLGAYTSFRPLTVSTWATPLDLLPVWYFHPTFNLLRVLF